MATEYMDRGQVERVLADRASRDDDFRAALFANPKAAISQAFEMGEMPDDLVINVVQETPNEIYIVLPTDPPLAGPVEDIRIAWNWLRGPC